MPGCFGTVNEKPPDSAGGYRQCQHEAGADRAPVHGRIGFGEELPGNFSAIDEQLPGGFGRILDRRHQRRADRSPVDIAVRVGKQLPGVQCAVDKQAPNDARSHRQRQHQTGADRAPIELSEAGGQFLLQYACRSGPQIPRRFAGSGDGVHERRPDRSPVATPESVLALERSEPAANPTDERRPDGVRGVDDKLHQRRADVLPVQQAKKQRQGLVVPDCALHKCAPRRVDRRGHRVHQRRPDRSPVRFFEFGLEVLVQPGRGFDQVGPARLSGGDDVAKRRLDSLDGACGKIFRRVPRRAPVARQQRRQPPGCLAHRGYGLVGQVKQLVSDRADTDDRLPPDGSERAAKRVVLDVQAFGRPLHVLKAGLGRAEAVDEGLPEIFGLGAEQRDLQAVALKRVLNLLQFLEHASKDVLDCQGAVRQARESVRGRESELIERGARVLGAFLDADAEFLHGVCDLVGAKHAAGGAGLHQAEELVGRKAGLRE